MKKAYVVFLEELFWVTVAVNVNLCHRIEDGSILAPGLDTSLQPREDQFKPIPMLDLINKLVDGEGPLDASEQAFDRCFVAINVKETTNNLRCSNGVDPLNVYLDEFDETVLVQIKDEIMNKVEAVADNNEWKLVG